ncbi:unnamed protein product [Schistosoma mansoni]|uniref:Smp_206290 n=1 Tax=Schistosoma mansoni TaxID=6183 RepID=UPI00022C8754|nr:unnamed protein product [Schistosoma mansoni]|eukprot:XP_018644830.1 unnamed protein product [Schistosoma mansoni]
MQNTSYVKCYLLPDRTKGSKRKTSYKKATCNPVYDEEFKYHILKQDLTLRTLQVSVWHHNALGLNLFLGEIFLPLTFHQFDQASHWYTLGEHVSYLVHFILGFSDRFINKILINYDNCLGHKHINYYKKFPSFKSFSDSL